MTKTQMRIYKRRWSRVQKAQVLELRRLSMPLKFKQLCFLMDSFSLRLMSQDHKREKETNKIRRRWMVLKERLGNGL